MAIRSISFYLHVISAKKTTKNVFFFLRTIYFAIFFVCQCFHVFIHIHAFLLCSKWWDFDQYQPMQMKNKKNNTQKLIYIYKYMYSEKKKIVYIDCLSLRIYAVLCSLQQEMWVKTKKEHTSTNAYQYMYKMPNNKLLLCMLHTYNAKGWNMITCFWYSAVFEFNLTTSETSNNQSQKNSTIFILKKIAVTAAATTAVTVMPKYIGIGMIITSKICKRSMCWLHIDNKRKTKTFFFIYISNRFSMHLHLFVFVYWILIGKKFCIYKSISLSYMLVTISDYPTSI